MIGKMRCSAVAARNSFLSGSFFGVREKKLFEKCVTVRLLREIQFPHGRFPVFERRIGLKLCCIAVAARNQVVSGPFSGVLKKESSPKNACDSVFRA